MRADSQQFAVVDLEPRLGDVRLNRRAASIVRAVARDPGRSFPKIFVRKAELEGFYRFTNNDSVSHDGIAEAVADKTLERAGKGCEVLALHDTTTFVLDREVDGVGPIQGRRYGFFGHVALGVSADGKRRPLGVLGSLPYVRKPTGRHKYSTAQLAKIPYQDKESFRWAKLIDDVEERAKGRARIIHVADREADTYPLLSHVVGRGARFVIRISRDRGGVETSSGGVERLKASMAHGQTLCTRTLPLSRRSPTTFANGLPRTKGRQERVAQLAISAQKVTFHQPRHWRGTTLPTLELNVVRVSEVDPPAGQEPVEWLLATTEPIDSQADVERLVDIYRARWLIEEFFKALKTGCDFESRQFESLDAFLVTLALLLPVATGLLELRVLARQDGERPAADFFGPTRMAALRHLIIEANYKLPPEPTLREAMLAVAAVGGHIKSNGEPGWIVLGRGFEDLVKAEDIWAAATRSAGKM